MTNRTLARFRACRRNAARRAGAGFTLIELLVVVAIIGLLISLVLPAMGSARESAQAIQCSSNLRTLSLSAEIYGTDNNDAYMPLWTPWWTRLLDDYYESNRQVLVCPVDGQATGKRGEPPAFEIDTNGEGEATPEGTPVRSFIYNGFNDALASQNVRGWQDLFAGGSWRQILDQVRGQSIRRTRLRWASDTAIFGEKRGVSGHHYLDIMENGGNDFTQLEPRRHFLTSANYAMIDGSVRRVEHPNALTPTNIWGATSWGRRSVLQLVNSIDELDRVDPTPEGETDE